MKMIVKGESSHNHENETDSVRNKKLFSNQLKRKCEDELERPSKIINTEIQKNPEQAQLFNEKRLVQNLQFSPTTLVADFEEAKYMLEQVCLSIEYKDANSEIGQWLKWIFGLPLLNAEEVSESFNEDFMSVVPDDARLKKFCDYLCDNYINETSKFNPKIWASSSISSERTTNSCESFHSKLNTQFTKAHPNIFHFFTIPCGIYNTYIF
ncbi:hypothetical protein QTP88_003442 [Uroleucon formosanum]